MGRTVKGGVAMDDRTWQHNRYFCETCGEEMEKSEELVVKEDASKGIPYLVAR